MISAFTAVITLLILIPSVPLVLYCIGLLLPSSHFVSRSHTYNTSPEILWAILTSVRDYPAWRSNIREVTIRSDDFESDINKYEDESRITFVEYSKKDRRTVVMHIEQEPERKLLRVLEERPYIGPSGETVQGGNSTFSGSWTFTLEPVEGQEKQVVLKITEQGVIKKPMVRVSHMLFFGYHRRIDRFIKDLVKEVELGILEEQQEEDDLIEEEVEEEGNTDSIVPEEQEEEEQEEGDKYEAGPDDSVLQTTTATTTSNTLLESKLLDKEWDMVNEIYDSKKV